MRRVVMTALFAALPIVASAGGVDVRVGGFFPELKSNLFTDPNDGDFALYDVQKSDFRGVTGGIEFNMRLVRNVEVGFSIDGYGRSVATSYRGFTRENDSEIHQTLKLEIVPVGLTLRLVPTSRHARLAPYLAAGVDAIFWHYEEFGDFIDFDNPQLPVIGDDFVAEGVTPGVHVAGGVRIPLNHDLSLVAEGRYQWAKEKDIKGDFRGHGDQLDLSGGSVTVGVHLRF
jgi:opacity protein-like surface antigen